MARGKKTFRDGSYYAHVWFGKRTVKEGEAAAVWDFSGRRKVVEGPRRVRLWFCHVRFLDRFTADLHQFLSVHYRDGRSEHLRGPVSLFMDPCVHERVDLKEAYKLSANEALVVYREVEKVVAGEPQAAVTGTGCTAESADGRALAKPAPTPGTAGGVLRRIVCGPSVYVPNHQEWVHTFSWHGSVGADGKGSKTGAPDDKKRPHALTFQVLRAMPDQMYVSVRDVRTKDDAQITVHLMIFYEAKPPIEPPDPRSRTLCTPPSDEAPRPIACFAAHLHRDDARQHQRSDRRLRQRGLRRRDGLRRVQHVSSLLVTSPDLP